jgi:hypothetical protein
MMVLNARYLAGSKVSIPQRPCRFCAVRLDRCHSDVIHSVNLFLLSLPTILTIRWICNHDASLRKVVCHSKSRSSRRSRSDPSSLSSPASRASHSGHAPSAQVHGQPRGEMPETAQIPAGLTLYRTLNSEDTLAIACSPQSVEVALCHERQVSRVLVATWATPPPFIGHASTIMCRVGLRRKIPCHRISGKLNQPRGVPAGNDGLTVGMTISGSDNSRAQGWFSVSPALQRGQILALTAYQVVWVLRDQGATMRRAF